MATLPQANAKRLRTDERGEVTVTVTLKDAADTEPVETEKAWAWPPKR